MALINLRDVPESTYRKAKVRAAQEGITLKALVIKAIEAYVKTKRGK